MQYRRRFPKTAFVATLLVAGGACSPDAPVASTPPSAIPPATSIADGSSPAGVPGFYFRPPLVASTPASSGEFDASLLDLLAVEVCEWDGSTCAALVRRLTAQDPLPQQLRIVEGAGYYQALWNTARENLDPAKQYRIRVLASGGELGHADVDVVDNASQGDVQSNEMVVLASGATLPIGFRIEKGLGERTGSAGGTVDLAGGSVSLTLPPGALPGDVFLTAVPAMSLPPNGPPVVPGTAWDFGPDGLQFATPVTMTISYDPADLPPGVQEAELRIHKLVNGTFVQANAGVVDLVNKKVSAQVDGFSVYVLLQRLFPGSPQDIQGPVVQALQVFDATTGTFAPSTTIDLSATDAPVRTRITLTDDISGVGGRMFIYYFSPSGHQRRFLCLIFSTQAPASGSDTNGEWECTGTWPQYSESGVWSLRFLFLEDKVGNFVNYFPTVNGICAGNAPSAPCISNPAQVIVNSSPTDTQQPALSAFDVSLNTQPRNYAASVMVDASTGPRPLVFRFQATDDLAGVGTAPPGHDEFLQWELVGPSGQVLNSFFTTNCPRVQGTVLNGTWECAFTMPQFAEVGTWRVNFLFLPDRVGNGGRADFLRSFRPNGSGQLCNGSGSCVTPPTIEVTSGGDAEPPQLQSVTAAVIGATVVLNATVTDNLSGLSFLRFDLSSLTVSQQQFCFATLSSGTIANGTWTCTLTFSQFAARGDWGINLFMQDRSGNARFYSRRASDGFLCYTPVGGGAQVCQNLGETTIVVQ